MPVELKSSSDVIPAGSAIKTEKGRNAGKFRSQVGNSGLALLRVAYGRGELLHVVLPNGARCEMVAHIPSWWPIDLLQ
ncbi:putative transferase [Apostichopus japonicus]|nr:putative transferase [Apostichopus japonicus]